MQSKSVKLFNYIWKQNVNTMIYILFHRIGNVIIMLRFSMYSYTKDFEYLIV